MEIDCKLYWGLGEGGPSFARRGEGKTYRSAIVSPLARLCGTPAISIAVETVFNVLDYRVRLLDCL